MVNKDLMRFVGSGDGSVEDLYSTGYRTPSIDDPSAFSNLQVTRNPMDNNSYNILADRAYDPGNSEQDFVFLCDGETRTFQYVMNTETSDLVKHNVAGTFEITIAPDTCEVSLYKEYVSEMALGCPSFVSALSFSMAVLALY